MSFVNVHLEFEERYRKTEIDYFWSNVIGLFPQMNGVILIDFFSSDLQQKHFVYFFCALIDVYVLF